jgi:ADP-ribosyl-[dinitrogen reductase] hydrolase
MERKFGALFGLFAGDATSMPVHWMYNLQQLRRDYGVIRGYVAPKDEFIGSIMNLSNTGGGGRGSDRGSIVGDVILHGKKKYWLRGGNYHYHLGLKAGENTLEAQLVRVLMRTTNDQKHYSPSAFLTSYIDFMTTPGSHNDTYASTCHRMFFSNLVSGVVPAKCADNDGHNVDAIDALTLAIPVIVRFADVPAHERNRLVKETVYLTRNTRALDPYLEAFGDLLVAVLQVLTLSRVLSTP